jgi:ribosome-binding factor A
MDPIARARLNAHLHEALVALLERAVKDPRVDGVTITGIEVTQDLSWAKVYFSILGGEEERRVAARGLANVAGFLRRELGRRLHLRAAPELRFEFDASLEHGQRIETLLREWHAESDGRPEATDPTPPGERPPDGDETGGEEPRG